jgi:hypothetical protein
MEEEQRAPFLAFPILNAIVSVRGHTSAFRALAHRSLRLVYALQKPCATSKEHQGSGDFMMMPIRRLP